MWKSLIQYFNIGQREKNDIILDKRTLSADASGDFNVLLLSILFSKAQIKFSIVKVLVIACTLPLYYGQHNATFNTLRKYTCLDIKFIYPGRRGERAIQLAITECHGLFLTISLDIHFENIKVRT